MNGNFHLTILLLSIIISLTKQKPALLGERYTEKRIIMDTETSEVRKRPGIFMRLLSRAFLFVAFLLISVIFALAMSLAGWLLTNIHEFSALLFWLVIIFGGTGILWLIFMPLVYGAPLTVTISEGIAPSRRGTRYIVFAMIDVIYCLFVFGFLLVSVHTVSIASIYMAIYGIAVGACGRVTILGRDEYDT